MLGLGRHLVRELGIEDSVDTLGRWIAHHVAELIDETEKASTREDQRRAYKHAVETILLLWEHRAALPRNAFPLARYREVVVVLEALRPKADPFVVLGPWSRTTEAQLASKVFDRLTRVIVAVLIKNAPVILAPRPVVAKPALTALDPVQRRLYKRLSEWQNLLPPIAAPGHSANARRWSKRDLGRLILRCIDDASTALGTLREQISAESTHSARRKTESKSPAAEN